MVNLKKLSMVLAILMVSGLIAGCEKPLHHGLDETEANAMVVALDRAGVSAEKMRDPGDGERWAVSVPSAQRVEAWEILEKEGLPREKPGGFGEFYPSSGLIPTSTEERIVLQYATARELQASLLGVDGIIDAKVHLVLPEKARVQMRGDKEALPRASVLVQWRQSDGEPPLSEAAIRELVSGGVEELEATEVHVVMSPIATPEKADGPPPLTQVGPIAVAPGSQRLLQVLILGLGAVIIVLSAGLVYAVFMRRRGLNSAAGGAP